MHHVTMIMIVPGSVYWSQEVACFQPSLRGVHPCPVGPDVICIVSGSLALEQCTCIPLHQDLCCSCAMQLLWSVVLLGLLHQSYCWIARQYMA